MDFLGQVFQGIRFANQVAAVMKQQLGTHGFFDKSGGYEHPRIRGKPSNVAIQILAPHVGHDQVDNDQIECLRILRQVPQGIDPVIHRHDLVAEMFEQLGYRSLLVGLVVDE